VSPSKNIPASFHFVTTKKAHTCEGCQTIIPTGQRALHVSGRLAGLWFNEYFCERCDAERIESIPDSKLREEVTREKRATRKRRWPAIQEGSEGRIFV